MKKFNQLAKKKTTILKIYLSSIKAKVAIEFPKKLSVGDYFFALVAFDKIFLPKIVWVLKGFNILIQRV